MKLIVEHTENVKNYITESADGVKKFMIEGVFMQADLQNKNKRIFPKEVLGKAVDKYIKEQVVTGRAVGELNHPESLLLI